MNANKFEGNPHVECVEISKETLSSPWVFERNFIAIL